MSFLFKNYSLVKVIYLLIRCYETRFFLWNIYNTDRNGVNKQNIHTHTHQTHRERLHWKRLASMKIIDTPSLKQPHLLYQPLHFYGKKNLSPPPFFFPKISKSHPHLFYKMGGGGFQLSKNVFIRFDIFNFQLKFNLKYTNFLLKEN